MKSPWIVALFCLAIVGQAMGDRALGAPAHCAFASHDEVRGWPAAERIAWLGDELAQCQDPRIQALSYYGRGKAFIDLGEFEPAVADLTQSIALNPQDVSYDYAARAFAYLHLNQQEEAVADATAALDGEPFFAQAYNTRGVAQCNLHHVQDGVLDILTAIELERDYATVWQQFLRKGGYYDGAVGGAFNAAAKAAVSDWCKTHRIAPGPIVN